MAAKNTLDYYNMESIMSVKSFIVQAEMENTLGGFFVMDKMRKILKTDFWSIYGSDTRVSIYKTTCELLPNLVWLKAHTSGIKNPKF